MVSVDILERLKCLAKRKTWFLIAMSGNESIDN